MSAQNTHTEKKRLHLPIFDDGGLAQNHEAALHILSNIGILLSHPGARRLLADHSAEVKDDRVLLPVDLVEKCLADIPTRVKLEGRDPEKAVQLGDGGCYPHNVGGVPNVFDPKTNTRQSASRKDNVQAARLLDALPNVSTITPLYTPQDVPEHQMTLWMTYDTLANTTKPFRAPGIQTGWEAKALAEIFQIACPKGRVTVGISPISPLTFPDGIVEAILEVSRQGLVLGPLPCPIMGATAPMSIAGALAQQNAEVLATVVLAQLTNPGLSIIYKGRLSMMDPRTGISVWGTPEIGIVSAATVDIAHRYGMPVDVYGLSTNALSLDIQNGYERGFNALLPVLAGADEISGVGEMDGGVTSSLAQMVIDNEILSSVKRIRDGFEVDEESLALEVITRAMEGSRNFLGERHTIEYLRKGEVLTTKLANRETWGTRDSVSGKELIEKAEYETQQLLHSHEVPVLADREITEIEEVIKKCSSS
jgi:trimethylamine--corrinoid protein Co-methyltransferase